MIRLSLCLATYNRGAFIGETLDSIIPQLTPEVELLIVDGASPDDTEMVVGAYVQRHPSIRYYREAVNSGIDADYDKAVGYARGDYCWLLPDDDLLADGAVARVLAACAEEPDLVVVDAVIKDASLTRVLQERRLAFSGERRYAASKADDFMTDAGEALSFIGATIIRRSLWLSRDRESYYGSLFIHVGVIFQLPHLNKAIVIGEPLVIIRYGNSMWTPRRFEIWMFKWPELIWSFEGYSAEAKSSLGPRYPWRKFKHLVSFRARGAYSLREYRRHFQSMQLGWWRLALLAIAVVPGKLLHFAGTAFFGLKGQISDPPAYELLLCSPYTNRASRWLASVMGQPAAR